MSYNHTKGVLGSWLTIVLALAITGHETTLQNVTQALEQSQEDLPNWSSGPAQLSEEGEADAEYNLY